jgi:hypothetical protein
MMIERERERERGKNETIYVPVLCMLYVLLFDQPFLHRDGNRNTSRLKRYFPSSGVARRASPQKRATIDSPSLAQTSWRRRR